MLRGARAMMARATLLSALLVLAPAAPAAALSCVHHPFQAPGERFGTGVLVAEIEVLDVRPRLGMDVRVLRVLHGREERPDGKTAVGYVGDLSTRERVMFEVLAARTAPSRAPGGAPTRSR
jgi:hypothetical protein